MPIRREARIKLSELPKFFGQELPMAINEFMNELVDESKKEMTRFATDYAKRRLPSGGGSYLGSIKFTKQRRRKDVIGTLYSDHEWAEAIEHGTQPHIIESQPGKAMSFRKKLPKNAGRYAKYIEEDVVVTRVQHPGARAFHVFENTARYLHRTLPKWIEYTLKRVGFG